MTKRNEEESEEVSNDQERKNPMAFGTVFFCPNYPRKVRKNEKVSHPSS